MCIFQGVNWLYLMSKAIWILSVWEVLICQGTVAGC